VELSSSGIKNCINPEDGDRKLSLNFCKIFVFDVAYNKKLYRSMNTKQAKMIVM
jgi:hypothetical protein